MSFTNINFIRENETTSLSTNTNINNIEILNDNNNTTTNEITLISVNNARTHPSERMGHVCTSIADRYLLAWGGHRFDDSRNEMYLDPCLLWIFDIELESWKSFACKSNDESSGDEENMPPILSGACSLITNAHLYLFGGSKRPIFGGYTDFHFNHLYKLDLKDLKWTKCVPKSGLRPSPRDKVAGWVHDNKLFYFGGFGVAISNKYLGDIGQFHEISNYSRRLGWNNQLISFDLNTETWQNHDFSSSKNIPNPRAAHSCTKINEKQVVLFGGRTMIARCNELYVLDLDTLTWSPNLNERSSSNNADNMPVGRSWHTMNRLDDNNLFLYGGLSQSDNALGDAWILNTKAFTWSKIQTTFEPRLWHTAVAFKHAQIYVYGGSSTDVYINQPTFPKHILKINLAPESLQKKCMDLICARMDLGEFGDEKFQYQIPLHLENKILMKYLTRNGRIKSNNNDDKENNNYSSNEISRKVFSRSEYCTIS